MIVNLTPHAISILRVGSDPLVVPPTAPAARVSMVQAHAATTLDGVDLYTPSWGDVTGLPSPRENTIYVVSAMVRDRVPYRRDVASPGELVRDAAGQPLGCKGLYINNV